MPNPIDLDIRADIARMKSQLSTMRNRTINKAASRALNRAIKSTRTEASKKIRERLNLKKAVVDAALKIYFANPTQLIAKIRGSVYHIALKEFKPYQDKDGVVVLVNRNRGQLHLPHAFISHKLGDHVFQRIGKDRLPIEKLYGPSVAQEIVVQEIRSAMKSKAGQAWRQNFLHELNFALKEDGINVS